MSSNNRVLAFCFAHRACFHGEQWARARCSEGAGPAEIWDQLPAEWLVWVATRPGVLDERTLRIFSCWCIRQVWDLVTDECRRRAVEAPERFERGEGNERELAEYWGEAEGSWDVASTAASVAGWGAAALTAGWDAAADERYLDCAATAAWDAAKAAAFSAQAKYLRELGNPFEVMSSLRGKATDG